MGKDKFAIIGAGHFGSAIALALSQKGAEVLVIDSNFNIVESISDDVAYAVCIDVTDPKALIAENIEDFDVVIVAIGNDFMARLLCTATLIDLKIKRIICRTMKHSEQIILEKMGISEFLSPEDEIGRLFAERLLNPNILSYLQLPDAYKIAEVITTPALVGSRLADIGFRENYKLSLVTIRRLFPDAKDSSATEEHIIGVPEYMEIIQKDDVFVVFGKTRDIDNFIVANQ